MNQFDEVILTDWVIKGIMCPKMELWEDDNFYYQFNRETKYTRKAPKTSEIEKFGDWYISSESFFKKF